MKYYELDSEEQELLDAVEADQFVVAEPQDQIKKEAVGVARATGTKTRNINIRVSEKVLHKLKAKAADEGVPYQTLVSSILHQSAR